jgi:hypothetical protein
MPDDVEASGEDDVMKNLSTFEGAKFLPLEGQKKSREAGIPIWINRLIYGAETAPCRFNVTRLLMQALLYKLEEC